jgi:hypothetical protein
VTISACSAQRATTSRVHHGGRRHEPDVEHVTSNGVFGPTRLTIATERAKPVRGGRLPWAQVVVPYSLDSLTVRTDSWARILSTSRGGDRDSRKRHTKRAALRMHSMPCCARCLNFCLFGIQNVCPAIAYRIGTHGVHDVRLSTSMTILHVAATAATSSTPPCLQRFLQLWPPDRAQTLLVRMQQPKCPG